MTRPSHRTVSLYSTGTVGRYGGGLMPPHHPTCPGVPKCPVRRYGTVGRSELDSRYLTAVTALARSRAGLNSVQNRIREAFAFQPACPARARWMATVSATHRLANGQDMAL